MPTHPLLLLLLAVVSLAAVAAEEATAENHDKTCLKDASQGFSTENYLDCKNSESSVAEGRTECCTIGGELGCCKPTEANRMLKIAAGIIGVAIGLGIIVYTCTWCDRETWPCIGRIQDAWKPRQHKLEESLICCRDRVERRRIEEEHRRKYAAKIEPDAFDEEVLEDEDAHKANVQLEAPQEFKATVQDSWF